MTYYEILGIEENATPEQIKFAYRSLAKKYHPDVNDASNANVFFRLIQEAYEILSDGQSRSEYDNQNKTSSATDKNSKETASNLYESRVEHIEEMLHEAGQRQKLYEQYVKLVFNKHSFPAKILSILARIVLILLTPIIQLLYYVFRLISAVAIFASWVLMIAGIVGGIALIAELVRNNQSRQSIDVWLAVLACFAGTVVGYYLPAFVQWSMGKIDDGLVNIKNYTSQLRIIFDVQFRKSGTSSAFSNKFNK